MSDFEIYKGNTDKGDTKPHDVETWPEAPPWRRFKGKARENPPSLPPEERGETFRAKPEVVQLVNAAIHLRRPLLVTGKPGTGKSSLSRSIAYELNLGRVLEWPITSRSTRLEGLYHYDAIGRLQDGSRAERAGKEGRDQEAPGIEDFIRLGPLGTALIPSTRPRVLLIDEIDKCDVDLPNDLLHVFENGEFEILELVREKRAKARVRTADPDDLVEIEHGRVQCQEFPIVILTSNGEREFPPAFKRRCIRLEMPEPKTTKELDAIISAHFQRTEHASVVLEKSRDLIEEFLAKKSAGGDMATDQLLNIIRLRLNQAEVEENSILRKALFLPLSGGG